MSHLADNREEQLAERELALSNARAALRAERAQIDADRLEADKILAEARAAREEAGRTRSRASRIARRFVRRAKYRQSIVHRELEEKAQKIAGERARLDAEIARFESFKSSFYTKTAAVQDRMREAWAVVRGQQKRSARDWIESQRHFDEELAILKNQANELLKREKVLADNRARIEAETAGFREEAASLETRIQNSRSSLAELELRRDRARAELLNTELPSELAGIAGPDDEDLTAREVLAREKAAVAALKDSLERESADISDNRRLIAEQFTMLAQARAQWQLAERETVIEMEQLARELGQRERDLDIREERLIQADVRRRAEAYDLWQLKMHLEAWQTKLTAFEMRWHTEREQQETDFERRLSIVNRRETEIEGTFSHWEKARTSERERLRFELELWLDDRARLTQAAADFDRQAREFANELSAHAARALAVEELIAGSVSGPGSKRAQRRLAVLRKRWERVFARQVQGIERLRAEAAAERAALDDRYASLQAKLLELVDREEALNKQEMAKLSEQGSVVRQIGETQRTSPEAAELAGLRNEIERLALMLLEVELPEPQGPSVAEETTWAIDATSEEDVVPFDTESRAA